MSISGLKAFDWIREVTDELHLKSRDKSYEMLRLALHALHDHLTIEDASCLLLCALHRRGQDACEKATESGGNQDFLSHVRQFFAHEPEISTEAVVRAVFKALAHRIPPERLDRIKNSLPDDLRALLLATAAPGMPCGCPPPEGEAGAAAIRR